MNQIIGCTAVLLITLCFSTAAFSEGKDDNNKSPDTSAVQPVSTDSVKETGTPAGMTEQNIENGTASDTEDFNTDETESNSEINSEQEHQ